MCGWESFGVEKNPDTVWMDTGKGKGIYLPRVYWVPNGKQVAFIRLDRLQQNLDVLIGNIRNGSTAVILRESDPYWINIEDHVHFFQDSQRFLWGSGRDGYRHLYLYDLKGALINRVTGGQWIVESLDKVDEDSETIYFTSTKEAVTERHVYRVSTDGSGLNRLTDSPGTHSAGFARSGEYFIDSHTDVLVPEQVILRNADGEILRYITEDMQPYLEKYSLKEPEFFTFQGSAGLTYHASLLKPPHFDPEEKYPVLIYVYGGPHAQVVKRSFGRKRELWHQMMANKGFIVFRMDNRGSHGRGHAWEQVVYGRLGKTELTDQLEGVSYLKSLPYVDSNRIGIWGWSYGGYMTLYALTHSDVFKAGASVAPVTDWRDYDTIYTERYMGLPQENAEGYRESSPVHRANQLSGNLLLVHGTGDDNVHFQNSVQMVDALIDAGIQFDFMIYPQQQHSISPTTDRIHLFRLLTRYFERHLLQ